MAPHKRPRPATDDTHRKAVHLRTLVTMLLITQLEPEEVVGLMFGDELSRKKPQQRGKFYGALPDYVEMYRQRNAEEPDLQQQGIDRPARRGRFRQTAAQAAPPAEATDPTPAPPQPPARKVHKVPLVKEIEDLAKLYGCQTPDDDAAEDEADVPMDDIAEQIAEAAPVLLDEDCTVEDLQQLLEELVQPDEDEQAAGNMAQLAAELQQEVVEDADLLDAPMQPENSDQAEEDLKAKERKRLQELAKLYAPSQGLL